MYYIYLYLYIYIYLYNILEEMLLLQGFLTARPKDLAEASQCVSNARTLCRSLKDALWVLCQWNHGEIMVDPTMWGPRSIAFSWCQ